MRVIDGVIGALWIAFWVYWLISAVGVKATRGRSPRRVGSRVAVVLVVFVLIRAGVFGTHAVIKHLALGVAGLVIVVLGLAFAAWARVYLGRNWGMPMTRKLDPELVTSGPYRRVRHPIYTGIILAMLGSALATSYWAFIAVVLLGGYFVYSARTEESFLAGQFPDTYPQYRRSTKMLIPFVL